MAFFDLAGGGPTYSVPRLAGGRPGRAGQRRPWPCIRSGLSRHCRAWPGVSRELTAWQKA